MERCCAKYFQERTSPDAVGRCALLKYFAQHLSILSNQLVVRREKDESTNMARARQFIEKASGGTALLGRVAQAANISRITFARCSESHGNEFHRLPLESPSREIEDAFAHPNSRISEAAFASGFQSMTNFNRAFRQIVGRSPTQFRESLAKLRRSV